jgi:hypothetical protein
VLGKHKTLSTVTTASATAITIAFSSIEKPIGSPLFLWKVSSRRGALKIPLLFKEGVAAHEEDIAQPPLIAQTRW